MMRQYSNEIKPSPLRFLQYYDAFTSWITRKYVGKECKSCRFREVMSLQIIQQETKAPTAKGVSRVLWEIMKNGKSTHIKNKWEQQRAITWNVGNYYNL